MKKIFQRWSKPLDKMVDVIGSEDQIKTCIVCNENKNQKHFHLCMKDNFGNYRTRTTCGPCYNVDRGHRRSMDLIYEQPKSCEICKTERKLFPDHCHYTKKHRGWLCVSCNTAIGQLGDNIKGINRAINYLTERGHDV